MGVPISEMDPMFLLACVGTTLWLIGYCYYALRNRKKRGI